MGAEINMLFLIYGADIVVSRNALNEEKEKSKDGEIITLDGRKVTLADVVTAAGSVSLFKSEKTIIIERLLKGGITREKEKIIFYLTKEKNLPKIIIWEESEVDKVKIKKFFSKAKVIHCPLPKLLFKFLDSLGSCSSSFLISMFKKLLKEKNVELVYVMILRQIRFLIIAKNMGEKGLALSPWQARKFISQSRYFKLNELILAYRNLLSLEYKLKTGATPYSFEKLLDIFLVQTS